jgi:hypothetical protein
MKHAELIILICLLSFKGASKNSLRKNKEKDPEEASNIL